MNIGQLAFDSVCAIVDLERTPVYRSHKPREVEGNSAWSARRGRMQAAEVGNALLVHIESQLKVRKIQTLKDDFPVQSERERTGDLDHQDSAAQSRNQFVRGLVVELDVAHYCCAGAPGKVESAYFGADTVLSQSLFDLRRNVSVKSARPDKIYAGQHRDQHEGDPCNPEYLPGLAANQSGISRLGFLSLI